MSNEQLSPSLEHQIIACLKEVTQSSLEVKLQLQAIKDQGAVPLPIFTSVLEAQVKAQERTLRFIMWPVASLLLFITGVKFGPEFFHEIMTLWK